MKILFIHHGDHRGGAPLSMLYTMIELRKKGFSPMVGLSIPGQELKKLYTSNGFETIDMPWIRMLYFWSANTMSWLKPSTYIAVGKALLNRGKSNRLTLKAIKEAEADIVHLNSVSLVTLVPMLDKEHIPYVWHIREHAPKPGNILFNLVTKLMRKSRNLIFLSQEEKVSWMRKIDHGTVVYNFVDPKKFNFNASNLETKQNLGLFPGDRVLLYLGGLKEHKGVDILISSLVKLKKNYPSIKCLMLDSVLSNKKPFVLKGIINSLRGKVSFEERMLGRIKESGLEDCCILLPFDSDAQKYFSVCEVVLFPALTPHFARPAIEAGIMKKPVIVSEWPVLLEIVEDGVTGLKTKVGDVEDLAIKIDYILKDKERAMALGENAYKKALETFTAEAQIDKIVKMYNFYK